MARDYTEIGAWDHVEGITKSPSANIDGVIREGRNQVCPGNRGELGDETAESRVAAQNHPGAPCRPPNQTPARLKKR